MRWMAIAVLKKYKPKIIGITGSIGKTSAKEAIYLTLCLKHSVRKNIKNYNNEIGIPLTIIGSESGGHSAWRWLKVIFQWLKITIFPVSYPEILVLEMGVDSPGDMKNLLDFIPLNMGVVTSISSVHLEYFKNIDHIAREKEEIVSILPKDGFAILNADDERVLAMKDATEARVITYGFLKEAEVRASDAIYVSENEKPGGLSFKLNFEGNSIPVRLKHILAKHQIGAALSAIGAGIAMRINLIEITSALEEFSSPVGRMNLLEGAAGSMIIDDSYNSSPQAAISALEVMVNLGSRRRIVVFGDMLELGVDEEKGHREVARKVFEIGADFFIGVGERMKISISELERLHYSKKKILWFDNPQTAGEKIKEIIQPGDLILVKGSQSMRMEKIVEKIMENPGKARNLLCRQSEDWWKKTYIKP